MMALLRTLTLPLLLAALLPAIDVGSLNPQGYVSDFAGVIDAASKQELEEYAGRLEKATGVQMALVTLRTIDRQPIELFANDLFRRWGIGQKGKDEGLLLLLVIDERRSRLEVGRGLEPIITDGTAGSLLRQMRPALRENRYGEALGTAAYELGQRIAQAKGVTIPAQYQPSRRVREEPAGDFPWPLVIMALLLLFSMFGGRRRRHRYGGVGGGGFLPGLILGNMMSRPWYGGHGRGGFGGYDSGDSFGGFGGGDSGGGGASSNW